MSPDGEIQHYILNTKAIYVYTVIILNFKLLNHMTTVCSTWC